jgi:hypothetical protein
MAPMPLILQDVIERDPGLDSGVSQTKSMVETQCLSSASDEGVNSQNVASISQFS